MLLVYSPVANQEAYKNLWFKRVCQDRWFKSCSSQKKRNFIILVFATTEVAKNTVRVFFFAVLISDNLYVFVFTSIFISPFR